MGLVSRNYWKIFESESFACKHRREHYFAIQGTGYIPAYRNFPIAMRGEFPRPYKAHGSKCALDPLRSVEK